MPELVDNRPVTANGGSRPPVKRDPCAADFPKNVEMESDSYSTYSRIKFHSARSGEKKDQSRKGLILRFLLARPTSPPSRPYSGISAKLLVLRSLSAAFLLPRLKNGEALPPKQMPPEKLFSRGRTRVADRKQRN